MEINSQPKVAMVVLSFNEWENTIECLESLFQIYYDNYHVIVVDNGSTDGSMTKIKQWADGKLLIGGKYLKYSSANKPIKYADIASSDKSIPDDKSKLLLMRSEVNLRFAQGNNLGIKFALSDPSIKYLLVLSNDTVVKSDFLNQMIKSFLKYSEAGLCGPKIVGYDSGKQWQRWPMPKRLNMLTMLMFFTPLKALFNNSHIGGPYLSTIDEPKKVYSVPGGCMFFKNTALNDIVYFDETAFPGWEEYIVAEKLFKQGYDTYVVPESVVYHKVSRSTKKANLAEIEISFLKGEKYYLDNYIKIPHYQRVIIGVISLISCSIISVFNVSYRRHFKELKEQIIDTMGMV